MTLAGVGSRFIAAAVDAAIESAVLVALGLLVFLTGGFGTGANGAAAIYVVVFFIFFWGYDVAFEVLASGRTPGKRWNGLRVVRTEGQPIGFLSSAVAQSDATDRLAPLAVPRRHGLDLRDRQEPAPRRHRRRSGRRARAPRRRRVATNRSAGLCRLDRRLECALGRERDHVRGAAAVRSFLERRSDIDWNARNELATTIAARLRPKVAGVPDHLRSEEFLEQLAVAKAQRS